MAHHLFSLPKLHIGDEESSRKVSWLELFFDLVYVAAVIELGYILSGSVSADGILSFIVLYIPIWWSWTGTTFYSNRFASDDVVHRLLTFIQIFFIGMMAINIYNGLDENFGFFAIAYALVRAVLILMYVRVWLYVPEARAYAQALITGFSIAAALWVVAALLPAPLRFVVAAVALGVDFFTALSPRSRRLQSQLPPSSNHLPERYALFTIIVFGELFLKVIRDLSGESAPLEAWIIGALMVAVSASLWWLYFDNVAESRVKWKSRAYIWVYSHLPLHIGITAFGVAVPKLIHGTENLKPEYRLLLAGSLAVTLAVIAVLEHTVENHRPAAQQRIETALRVIGVGLIALLAFTEIAALPLALLTAVIAVAQVVVNIIFHRAAGDMHHESHPLEFNPE